MLERKSRTTHHEMVETGQVMHCWEITRCSRQCQEVGGQRLSDFASLEKDNSALNMQKPAVARKDFDWALPGA